LERIEAHGSGPQPGGDSVSRTGGRGSDRTASGDVEKKAGRTGSNPHNAWPGGLGGEQTGPARGTGGWQGETHSSRRAKAGS